MNRNYIHDIKPSSRMQKRRAAFDREHEIRMRKMGLVKKEKYIEESEYSYDDDDGRSGGKGIWYAAVLAVIVLVFALTHVFSVAKVSITPRQGTVELTGPLTAEKVSRNGLAFQMMVVEDSAITEIASDGEIYVEKKATGTVRFFNNNSTNSQKLLIDTRLVDASGKIYKTKTATTIPGQVMSGGKLVPGTVDVAVYADDFGESYNLEKDVKLQILGFKGGPKYETIYAQTITPVSGGFKGEVSNISEDELKSKTESLKESLTKTLFEKARAQVPESFVFYEKSSLISFIDPVVETSEDGETATIKVSGSLNAVIFKESELTKALVSGVVSEEDKDKVYVSNIRELNIELDPTIKISDPNLMETVKLYINDKVNVVWDLDEESIKNVLLGVRKKEFESKMIQFKNIDKAELDLKPFWRNRLPEKTTSIKIINTLKQPPII